MAFRSPTVIPGNGATLQLIKTDRSMLALSDETSVMKQIQATHSPDGREFDVRPLLDIVEDILKRATLQVETTLTPTASHAESDDKNRCNFISKLETLSFVIDRICCEICYNSLGGSDAHAITLSIFSMLSNYSWDAKLVLTMAAFASNYGEFWLLAQIYSSNQLAKSVAILKQLPIILEHSGLLRPRFEALNHLIRIMLEVTGCIVEFRELPSTYISTDMPALSTATSLTPTAVYWTIRSVVACATQISSLTTMGHEFATTEAWELSTLAHKLGNIDEHLKKQLSICYQHIEEKRTVEAYQVLVTLFETIHIDNIKILKTLIYSKDDIPPLVEGSTKKRVKVEVLMKKNVLLLISGLDISQDELSILEQIYKESRLHPTRAEVQYEVVWIPIVDHTVPWTECMQKQFESLQDTMPWYVVNHPSMIDKVVIKFVKEVWHYRSRPILVVLDSQGRVVCPNALHMMWIWGSHAFPFTSSREEFLWKEETWKLELLVDGIDKNIMNWINEERYILLYGGDDIEWVRKFTSTARSVALEASIPLEMVYVGKSSKREKVQRVIATIIAEKLSYVWEDLTMIWFFWTRLESMLYSKLQLGKIDEEDSTMLEIKKLLSYDKEGGWAVFSKGSNIVVNGHSSAVLPTLTEYEVWKEQIEIKGFELSFKEHHEKIHCLSHTCCRFEFSRSASRIPEQLRCPECHRVMEKYISFLCCHED